MSSMHFIGCVLCVVRCAPLIPTGEGRGGGVAGRCSSPDGGGASVVAGWIFFVLGSLATLFLFYSPYKTILAIKEAGDVAEQQPDLYLAVLNNCLVWLLYGFVTDTNGWMVICINGLGVCAELYYLYVFIRASTDRFTTTCSVVLVLLIVAFTAVIIFLSYPTDPERKKALGWVEIATGGIMYLGSSRQLWAAITADNVLEVMELRVIVATLINSVLWTTYAGIIHDLFMGIPNWAMGKY